MGILSAIEFQDGYKLVRQQQWGAKGYPVGYFKKADGWTRPLIDDLIRQLSSR